VDIDVFPNDAFVFSITFKDS